MAPRRTGSKGRTGQPSSSGRSYGDIKRVVEERKEQDHFNDVLDRDVPFTPKDITCEPVTQGCLPLSRSTSSKKEEENKEAACDEEQEEEQKEEQEDSLEAVVESESGEEEDDDGHDDEASKAEEDAAANKAENASSFWARWGRNPVQDSASLKTGKGNRLVSRTLRDAREDAVCKVETASKVGCGMLVTFKGHLAVLTNNHIIPDEAAAEQAVASFQTASMGTVDIRLKPNKFFCSSAKTALDYTFVACETPAGVQAMELVKGRQVAVNPGDTLVIVQYPAGGEKGVAVGPAVSVHSPYLSYEVDTEDGSSGSAVFKDYEPLALHHRAPREPEQRGFLSSMSCSVARKKTNRGVLLTAIMDNLEAKLPKRKSKDKSAVDKSAVEEEKDAAPEENATSVPKPDKSKRGSKKDKKGKQDKQETEKHTDEKSSIAQGAIKDAEGFMARLRAGATCMPSSGAKNPDVEDDDVDGNQNQSESKWGRLSCMPSKGDAEEGDGKGGWDRTCTISRSGKSVKAAGSDDDNNDDQPDEEKTTTGGGGWRESVVGALGSMTGGGGDKSVSGKKGDKISRVCGIAPPSGMASFGRRVPEPEAPRGGTDAGDSQEAAYMRAGIAGQRVVIEGETDEKGAGGQAGDEDAATATETDGAAGKDGEDHPGRRMLSKALGGQQCGVGLVLEAWRPKGLAHALNVLTGTHEAVRVDQVVGDGPADHAVPRLEKGDQLKAIDGEAVTGLEQAKKMIIGMSGTKVTMKFARNQYTFEVTMVRGLRGGPSSMLQDADSDAEEDAKAAGQPPEPPRKKLVNGLPTLYSRSQPAEEKSDEGGGEAEAEGRSEVKTSRATDALEERLKALGVNSFSGDAEEEEEEEEEEGVPASKAPFARFNDATAPKMRGVIASGSGSRVEQGQELLDKALLGDVGAIRLLVASGADVNFVDEEEGWGRTTPLLNAATAGSKPAVLALLLLGARVDAADESGWTALHRAGGKGHKAIVTALLQAGSDPAAKDKSGLTAADWARFCGFEEVALVLAQGAVNGSNGPETNGMHTDTAPAPTDKVEADQEDRGEETTGECHGDDGKTAAALSAEDDVETPDVSSAEVAPVSVTEAAGSETLGADAEPGAAQAASGEVSSVPGAEESAQPGAQV